MCFTDDTFWRMLLKMSMVSDVTISVRRLIIVNRTEVTAFQDKPGLPKTMVVLNTSSCCTRFPPEK